MHEFAPSADVDPELQGKHAELPFDSFPDIKVPAMQMQAVFAVLGLECNGHAKQALAPPTGAYFPSSHAAHPVASPV